VTEPARATAPGATAAALMRDDELWEAFLAAAVAPSHLQSSAWAAVKRPNGWGAFRIAVEADDRLVGAQVLVQRPRGVPWGMGYVGRGPVTTDGALTRPAIVAFTAALRSAGRRHRLGYVRMEPEVATGAGFIERELIRAGWRRAPHVQPDRTLIIDLAQDEAAILAGMHRKTRQSVSKSERLGVRVVDADGSRMNEFYAIHTDAMTRAGIATRTQRTYQDMWDHLAPRGMARLLFAEATDTGEPIATLFLVSCGRRVVDLYGGTTVEGGKRRANHLLKWEAIRRCRADGFLEYDLWGLPREGIEAFKSGFGGREVDYIGAWDLGISTVGKAVLDVGVEVRARFRRWRFRDVHDPDDPHGRGAAATADDTVASAPTADLDTDAS